MADKFFKKPEFYERFTLDEIINNFEAINSYYLVIRTNVQNEGQIIVGSLFLHWKIENDDLNKTTALKGYISSVAVVPKFSKQGIGKRLISDAEDFIKLKYESNKAEISVIMELGIINLRADLFKWYSNQGYYVVSEIRPNDNEFEKILLPNIDVCIVLMRKILV